MAQASGGAIPYAGDIALALLFVTFAWLGYILWNRPVTETSLSASTGQPAQLPLNS